MKQTFWYTFATEVLAFSEPNMKFVIGIVKQDTAKKLQNDEAFILMPKNGTRHVVDIFKPSIQNLYSKSKELTLILEETEYDKNRKYLIQYYSKILKEYQIDYENENDRKFIKLISPLCPWTSKHVSEYLTGKSKEIPKTVGLGSVLLLEVHRLDSELWIEYRQAHRDSSQIKKIELNDPINFSFNNPIHERDEYKELIELVDFVYHHTR